jgi:hypothetical protein
MMTKVRILPGIPKNFKYNFFGNTTLLPPGRILAVPGEVPPEVADEWIYMGWAEEVKE